MSANLELMGDTEQEIVALSQERRALFETMYKEHIGTLPLLQAPLIRRPWQAPLPMAPNQERMWLIQNKRPQVPLFNNPLLASLEGTLDVDVLQQALQYFAQRHEALRVRFADGQGTPLMEVSNTATVPLKVFDLCSSEQQQAELERLTHEQALLPFDLAEGKLMRASLFILSERKAKLLVNAHHIVSDGWSGAIFQREIVQIYASLVAGTPPQLPPLAYEYRDYAIWLRQWQTGLEAKRQVAFWKQKLAGIEQRARLPRCYPCQERTSYAGQTVSAVVDRATMQAVSNAARAQRTSLFVFCLAAFKSFLQELTGQHDIVIGTPHAGRVRRELDGIYGYLVNKQVLRTKLDGTHGFAQVLARVKDSFGDAFEHQDAPILDVIRSVCPERVSEPDPLYNIVFTLSDLTDEDAMRADDGKPAPALQFTDMRGFHLHMAEFELNVALHPEGDAYRLYFFYSSELFSESAVQAWLTRYLEVLRLVAQ